MVPSKKRTFAPKGMPLERKGSAPSPNGVREHAPGRVSTGVAGLDEVLYGGLVTPRAYLVAGRAGACKTTLGLHFLTAGLSFWGEGLFFTLGEPEEGRGAKA